MSTLSNTLTYTVVDIGKVVENFAADYHMKAQATGLCSREIVNQNVYDIKVFAEYGYLSKVDLYLKNTYGNILRATVYKVEKSVIGSSSDRPGNNLWPQTPGGSLNLRITLTEEWFNKSDNDVKIFAEKHRLYGEWPTATEKISLSHLVSNSGQRYISNGYGWERTNYQGI